MNVINNFFFLNYGLEVVVNVYSREFDLIRCIFEAFLVKFIKIFYICDIIYRKRSFC